jgi:hypothetical protein
MTLEATTIFAAITLLMLARAILCPHDPDDE